MKRVQYYKINAVLFLIVIFLFFIINFFKSDTATSNLENRTLKKKPKVDIDNIISGRYQTKFEKYVNDQFFIRDKFIKIKSESDALIGKKENNGVFFGKDDFLFEKISEPVTERVEKNIQSINSFKDNYKKSNFYFELVPTSATIYEDKLPDNAPVFDERKYEKEIQDKLSSDVEFISPYDLLVKNSEQYIYYRTDHHWTTLGAYLGYLEFCSSSGISPFYLDNYKNLKVTDSFYGTLFSKSLHGIKKADEINVYVPDDDDKKNGIIQYVDENQVATSFYDTSYLENNDKYSVFLRSNHPYIKVTTTCTDKKSIVIFKDSFANCFIPFLTSNYSNIFIVDPRYYCGNIDDVMKEAGNSTDVLFLYNYNTFATDNNLYEVLNNED